MTKSPAKKAAASKPKEKAAVPSVEKALEVLEFLSDCKEGATMNELVDGLGRSMGELYRLVVYLTEQKYLAFDKVSSRYSLTLRLFELSHRHNPTEQMIGNAVPLMERFAALTDQSCHLGVLNRANILILASIASPRPAGYSVRTGAIFPVEATSTGNVIVAFSGEEARQRFLKRMPARRRSKAGDRLSHIAELGYEDLESEIVAGVRNLSVPVFDVRGVVAAMTCGYIEQRPRSADPEETLAILRNIASELSHSLGYAAMQTGS